MPEWMTYAEAHIGVKEIPGRLHNRTILGWLSRFAKNIGKWGQSRDETPWCAVFVSAMLDMAGIKGTDDARAVSYKAWGRPSKIRRGAIVVIRRRRKDGENKTGSNRGGYHVFFLDKITKNFYWGVGGNQRNQVSRAAYSKANYELVAIRWPGPDEGYRK